MNINENTLSSILIITSLLLWVKCLGANQLQFQPAIIARPNGGASSYETVMISFLSCSANNQTENLESRIETIEKKIMDLENSSQEKTCQCEEDNATEIAKAIINGNIFLQI